MKYKTYKEKYERLYQEHCRVCKLLESVRDRYEHIQKNYKTPIVDDLLKIYEGAYKARNLWFVALVITNVITLLLLFIK